MLSNYNELKLIGPPEGAVQPIRQDIALRVGRTIAARVVGPDGKPMAGVRILGGTSHQFDETTSNSAGEFSIKALDPGRKRTLNLVDARQEAGILRRDPWRSAGAIDDPPPVHAAPLSDESWMRTISQLKDQAIVIHRLGYIGTGDYSTRTDATGAFRVEGLVPGQPYQANGPRDRHSIYERFTVAPGEAKDLGEGRIQP